MVSVCSCAMPNAVCVRIKPIDETTEIATNSVATVAKSPQALYTRPAQARSGWLLGVAHGSLLRLKILAERKGGRLLTGMERSQGARTDLTSGQAVEKLEYQDGVKICGGYKNAERWQLSGTVSDEDYETWLDSLKGEAFPTSAGLRNFAKRQTAEQDMGLRDTETEVYCSKQ